MKNFLFISLLLAILPIAGMAQQKKPVGTNASSNSSKAIKENFEKLDSLLEDHSELLDAINVNTSLKNRFKLYPTENIYTFLELDTKTGRVWQLQWDMDSDNEGGLPIVDFDLVAEDDSYGSNVFELYPTKNIFQFILVNKVNGQAWHLQWGMENTNRWVRKMKNPFLPKDTEE